MTGSDSKYDGTGNISRGVLPPCEPDCTQATVVAGGALRPAGVMSDYEVERALICRIESMSGDEARRWLVRMGHNA